MKSRLIIIIAFLMCFGCFEQKENIVKMVNDTSKKEQVLPKDGYNTDVKELMKYVNLKNLKIDTLQPVKWNVYAVRNTNERAPGPTDYYLIASFKVLPDQINDKLEVINTTNSLGKDSTYYRQWLPESLNVLFEDDKTTEDITVYSGEPFKKSPYMNGFLCKSKNNDVYLYMYTR